MSRSTNTDASYDEVLLLQDTETPNQSSNTTAETVIETNSSEAVYYDASYSLQITSCFFLAMLLGVILAQCFMIGYKR